MKAESNLVKHRVSFGEAEEVFDDVLSITVIDPSQPAEEERFITVGVSRRGRLLTIGMRTPMMKSELLQRVKPSIRSAGIMKDESNDEIPLEVDFSNGVRGKYAGRIRHDAIYVPLEADVSDAFRTPEEVNSALRMLIKTAAAVVPSAHRKAS